MKRSVSLLVTAALATAGGLSVATPALAAPGCPSTSFCLHDTNTVNPSAIFPGELPRNTCFQVTSPGIASFVTNNTGVQWWLFRTGTCGGSHIAVHSWTDLDLRTVDGWDNAVAAVIRTSTIG